MIEHRYTDVDYRDEHGIFYAQTFRRYPAITHRVHLFAASPPAELGLPDVVAEFAGDYLGYAVLRPVPGACVGRTVIAPPQTGRLDGYRITCSVRDTVNLFGHGHAVCGVPFIAQDAQLGVCAHASVWVAAYIHRLRYGTPRHLPGAIAAAAPPELGLGRPVPNQGLTVEQIAEAFRRLGLPALVYRRSAGTSTLAETAVRYLDSGLPVIAVTSGHAFALVGHNAIAIRARDASFVCQDDEYGPYQLSDAHRHPRHWTNLVVPLPEQIYVPAERAEVVSIARLGHELDLAGASAPADAFGGSRWKQLRAITSAVRSNEFKRTLADRGYSPRVAAGYMRMPMSKWVWITELVDPDAHAAGLSSVLAEAVIDSTDHTRDIHTLAWRIPGLLTHWNSDTDRVARLRLAPLLPQPFAGIQRMQSIAASAYDRDLEPR